MKKKISPVENTLIKYHVYAFIFSYWLSQNYHMMIHTLMEGLLCLLYRYGLPENKKYKL